MILRPHITAMFFNDFLDDGQPQSGAFVFGGGIGLEQLVDDGDGNARAMIADADFQPLALSKFKDLASDN